MSGPAWTKTWVHVVYEYIRYDGLVYEYLRFDACIRSIYVLALCRSLVQVSWAVSIDPWPRRPNHLRLKVLDLRDANVTHSIGDFLLQD